MKKLMTFAAVTGLVMVSSAASFQWTQAGFGVSTLYSAGTSTAVEQGVTMYLFEATDSFSQKDLLSAVLENNTDIASLAKVTTNTVAKGGGVTAKMFDYGEIGSDYDYFFAVLKDDLVYVSSTLSDQPAYKAETTDLIWSDVASTSQKAAEEFNSDTYTDGTAGWYSVPEPSSAMLMMFGLGLMALKRKRA